MTDPDNMVNRTLEAERVTGIRGGTAVKAQQGVSQTVYNTGNTAELLARTIRWLWSKVKR